MKAQQFRGLSNLRLDLVREGWRTPDTYSNDFAQITNRSAVYLFLLINQDGYDKAMVAYVGMSTKLLQRLTGHSILAEIDTPGYWPMRWFKPVAAKDLRSVEAKYITQFDPPWNVIGRPRGVQLP